MTERVVDPPPDPRTAEPRPRLRPEVSAALVARVLAAFEAAEPLYIAVRGEAGFGKSTLLDEVVADVTERVGGVRVARQTSVQAEADMSLVGINDLAEMLGYPSLRTQDDSPTIAAQGVEWRAILEQHTKSHPLLIVCDDAQWLDQDSVDVFGFALRRVRDIPLVVLSGVRWQEFSKTPRPRRLELLNRIDVDLDPPEPQRMADVLTAGGVDLPDTRTKKLIDEARGNIFWARELARADDADGYDLQRASSTARDRLSKLARALTDETRCVVATIQLAGRPTTSEIRAAIQGEVDDPGAAINGAELSGVIALHEQRWTTTHPLLGEAALAALDPARRVALQRRLADAVHDPEQRVRLVAEFERPPHEPTAELLVAAAEAAANRGSISAAVDLMTRAVAFTDQADTERRGQRQAAVVTLHLRRGAFDEVLATASALDLDHLSAAAFDAVAAAVADAALLTGGHNAAQAMIARVEASAHRRGDAMSQAVALALSADRDYGTAHDKYAAALAAAEVLETAPWPSPAAHMVLGSVCTLGLDRGLGLDETVVDRRRALEPRLRRAGLMPPSTDSADALRAYVGKQLGDPESSVRQLPLLIEQADRGGEEFAGFAFRVHLAIAHQICGEFEAARPLLDAAQRSLGRVPVPYFPLLLPARYWQALADEGPEPAAYLVYREQRAEPAGPPRWRLVADYLLGSAALLTGHPDEALPRFRSAREIAKALGLQDPGRRYNLDVLLAETLVSLGELDEAEVEVGRLLAFARPRHRDVLVEAGDRMSALIIAQRGDPARAAAQLEQAAARVSKTVYRMEEVRTLLALARVERLRRRVRAAEETLDAAAKLSAAMPFATGLQFVRREREALSKLGHGQLTPTERHVAELVATGATARAAAAQLQVSPRTVESHLRAIYRKLGVSGRVGLVALVHTGELAQH